MAKLTAEIQLLLGNTAEFSRQVTAALNRSAYGAGRSMGPQYGAGLAASPQSQAMALSGLYAPGGAMGAAWHYTGPQPPIIPGGGGRPNYGTAGLGLLAGMFSPWIGGGVMMKSGIFNTAIGKQISGLFGGGQLGNFYAAYTAITLASRGLKAAFDELKHSVERVAKLYQESAAINRPVGRIAQVQAGFAAIGLSADAAKRYSKSGPGGLNAEEMMQLTNMSDRFQRAMAQASMDSQIISNAAESSQTAFEGMVTATRELNTLWVSMGPIINEVLLKPIAGIAALLNAFQLLGQQMGLGNYGMKSEDKWSGLAGGKGGFNWQTFKQTSMERMGFTIGGNGVNSLLQRSNYYLAIIAEAAKGGVGGGGFGGGMATNLP